jgi:hypothetical protein
MTCIDADYLAYVRFVALDSCGRQVPGANKQMVVTDQIRRVAFDDAIERGADRVRRGVTGAACRSVPGCVTESPKPFTVDWCGFNYDFAALAGLATKTTPTAGTGYARTEANCLAALAAELVFKPPVDQSCSGGSAQCLRLFFPKIATWGPANGFELTGADDVDNFASYSGMAIKNPGVFQDFGHVSSDLAVWAEYWEDAPNAIYWVHYGDCPVTPTASCSLSTLAASPS